MKKFSSYKILRISMLIKKEEILKRFPFSFLTEKGIVTKFKPFPVFQLKNRNIILKPFSGTVLYLPFNIFYILPIGNYILLVKLEISIFPCVMSRNIKNWIRVNVRVRVKNSVGDRDRADGCDPENTDCDQSSDCDPGGKYNMFGFK